MITLTARHTKTGIVSDYPANIVNHRVLGRNLEVLDPEGEFEEDKVVIDKKVKKTAKPKAPEPVAENDQENDVDFSFFSDKAGE